MFHTLNQCAIWHCNNNFVLYAILILYAVTTQEKFITALYDVDIKFRLPPLTPSKIISL